MYYLTIWDTEIAASGQDGCLSKIAIPIELARQLFQLDSKRFPILSSLSFDDYDIFSGKQIEAVIEELIGAAGIYSSHSEAMRKMMDLASEAFASGKSILFDPFREQ